MIVLRLLMLLLLVFLSADVSLAFPSIQNWENSPLIVFENKKQANLKKDQSLKSPFVVVTDKNDQFEMKLNIFDSIRVFSNTKLQIVDFSDETGFVQDVYLLGGSIRFKSTHRDILKKDQGLTVKTPFFDLKTNFLADFIIDLDMKAPSVEVKVIDGVVPLEFFAYEKKVSLKPGEKVKFNGLISEDGMGIKYDYLLNNRKAPQGKLNQIEKFDIDGFNIEQKNIKKAEENRKLAIKKKEEEKKRKQKEYEDSFLCKKPFAQKDQCAWYVEGGKCFRKRCNASGKWGDLIERPMTQNCKSGNMVKECDY